MKKLSWIILIIAILLYLLTRDYGRESNTPGEKLPMYSSTGDDEALQLIKTEPKVMEAIITDANVLYVSVVDDGTRRDGYASYLCEILREKNASTRRVKVVKVNSIDDPNRDNAYGILLGEAWCD